MRMASHRVMKPACPCCGTRMDPLMIVCWPCFRLTDRLTPGEYRDLADYPGRTWTLHRADVTKWEKARERRVS